MAQGDPATPPDKRRTQWVRLADVPLEQRYAAYKRWLRSHPNEKDADAMAFLVLCPGNAGGWIRP